MEYITKNTLAIAVRSQGVWQMQLNVSYIIPYSVIDRDVVASNFNYSASIDHSIFWWESLSNS